MLYRNACLRAWGYAIVSVPWHEWVALCGSEHSRRAQSAKEDFLLRMLAPVLPDRVAREGPYGEYTGYRIAELDYGLLVEVRAITHRDDPIHTTDCTGFTG